MTNDERQKQTTHTHAHINEWGETVTTMAGTDTSTDASKASAALWITYINIVLYALCFQLQRPVEPFLVKSLSEEHADPQAVNKAYGQLGAFFSTIQMLGSPLVGMILDRYGIRVANSVVFLASAASYAILASASTMELLFLSKVPTALQGAFIVAQATASVSTGNNAAARAQALGRMTTAYTIGATIGPALGGWLVDTLGDLYLGAKLAVAGSLLSVALSILYLPHGSNKSGQSETKDQQPKNRSFLAEMNRSLQIAARPHLWPLLVVKVVGGVSASLHSTALPLVLTQTLNFDPSQLGLSMSSSMFAVAGFGAFFMAPLATWIGPTGMAKSGLSARTGMILILAFVVTTSIGNGADIMMRIITISVIYALTSHVLATGLTTQTTGGVSDSEQGTLLGLEHALFALARIGAPPLATTLLGTGRGFWAIASVCSVVDLLLVGLLVVVSAQIDTVPEFPSKAVKSKSGRKWPDDEHSD